MKQRSSRRTSKTSHTNRKNGGHAKHARHIQDDSDKVIALNQRLKIAFKNDYRGPQHFSGDLQTIASNTAISTQVPIDPNTFAGVILGAISYALNRGWSLNVQDDNYIYFAFVYQTQLLVNAAQGAVPQSNTVPYWLSLCLQAVLQTSVPFKIGHMAYAANITTPINTAAEQLIGPTAYKHVYSLGIKESSLVNGMFPVVGAPASYSEEEGAKATQSLWIYLEALHKNDAESFHRMVSSGKANVMTKDVSAFATVQGFPGGGFAGSGAWFREVQLEVPIRRPIFAVFSESPEIGFTNRGANQLRLTSGDSITLGGCLVSEFTEEELKVKLPPIIKYNDFLWFADIFCRAIQSAIQLRLETAAFLENIASDPDYYETTVQCPLTMQNFLLMFKATMMIVFKDNFKCQGTYPRSASSKSDSEFVVYPVGVQSYPIETTEGMYMPQMMQQFILNVQSRSVRRGTANPKILLSCLGEYANTNLFTEDYPVTYEIEGVTITKPIFVVDKAEVEISRIDGYFVSNPDGICAINDPSAILPLIAQFNGWIVAQGDHFRRLTTVDADPGVNPLYAGDMTMHWSPVGREKKSKKKVPSKEKKSKSKKVVSVYKKLGNVNIVENGIYADRMRIAVSCGHLELGSLYTGWHQFQPLPVNKISSASSASENTGYQRIAAQCKEPIQIPQGSGSVNFASIAAMNQAAAELMVKTKFAEDTAQELMIDELSETGHAGMLGTFGAALLGEVAKAGIGVGAQVLQNVTPKALGYLGNVSPI